MNIAANEAMYLLAGIFIGRGLVTTVSGIFTGALLQQQLFKEYLY